jgi:alanine dehydrogenase
VRRSSQPLKKRAAADVLKVKEPIASEYKYFREGLVLFTYLHLAAEPELTKALVDAKVTGIAYETVQLPTRQLPLLAPMSEVAGRLAPILGANVMLKPNGGPFVLLPEPPRKGSCLVAVLQEPTRARLLPVWIEVTVLYSSASRLDALYDGRIKTIASNSSSKRHALKQTWLLVQS